MLLQLRRLICVRVAGARSVANLRNPSYTLSLTTAIKGVELDKLIKTTAGTSDSQQSAFEYSVITNDATRTVSYTHLTLPTICSV